MDRRLAHPHAAREDLRRDGIPGKVGECGVGTGGFWSDSIWNFFDCQNYKPFGSPTIQPLAGLIRFLRTFPLKMEVPISYKRNFWRPGATRLERSTPYFLERMEP